MVKFSNNIKASNESEPGNKALPKSILKVYKNTIIIFTLILTLNTIFISKYYKIIINQKQNSILHYFEKLL